MSQDKVKGKFYPLQHEEWLRACQELTPAQRDVLYFIRTLDPYGNGVRISAAEIARRLSTPQRKVHRQTISRALKELDAKGFIDLELIEVQIEVKPKGYWCDETPAVRQDTTLDRETPREIVTHHATSETRSGQEVSLSKTYKDFKDSLSEETREKFLAFVRKEVKNFPRPISDLESWLASETKAGEKRWEVYYKKFEAGKQPQEKAPKRRRLHEEIEQRKRELEEQERLTNQQQAGAATG